MYWHGIQRLGNTLAWRLIVWFLLLSLIPLAVVGIFIRQDLSDTLQEQAANNALAQARLLAKQVALLKDQVSLPALVAATDAEHRSFLLSKNGAYIAHPDPEKRLGSILSDFAPAVVEALLTQGSGVVIAESGRIIGFTEVPGENVIAVFSVDGTVVSGPRERVERSAITQLGLALAVVAIGGGVAIWVLVWPLHKLTHAAQQVGAGNLDVEVDPSEAEGEIETLSVAFNQMTSQLRGLVGHLEDRVAERTGELRQSEERYRSLFEESKDAIFVSAASGEVIDANQAALDLFGFTRDQAIGADVGERYIDPADQMRFREEIDKTGVVHDFEVRLLKRDGTVMDCLMTASRRHAEDGSDRPGILGIVRDVTERKKAQESLLQQEREMGVLEERNRVAREIHDTLAQGFTGIVLQLEAAEQVLEGDAAEVANHLGKAKNLARQSLQEARRSVWDLRPQALEGRSLEVALEECVREFASASQEKTTFDVSGRRRELPPNIQAALLRICQESLTNIRRHAEATEVIIRLLYRRGAISLHIQDNGRGYDPDGPKQGGFGLLGMQERARLLGGAIVITSQQGEGTTIEVEIPTTQE